MTPPSNPETGKPVGPDLEDLEGTWSSETINAPKIFPVAWKARDEKRAEAIRRSWEDAQGQWQVLGLEPDVR